MSGFVEMHGHFVYGVDDGAQDQEAMFRLLDQYVKKGVTTAYATSHQSPGMKTFDQAAYLAHLDEARRYCEEQGYDLELLPGAELMWSPMMILPVQSRSLPTLGDTASVLVEFLPNSRVRDIEYAVRLLTENGYLPILAHIERYSRLTVRALRELREKYPVRCQVNCAAVLGDVGLFRRYRVQRCLREKLVDFVSSDAHDALSRPVQTKKAYKILKQRFGRETAWRLTRGRI